MTITTSEHDWVKSLARAQMLLIRIANIRKWGSVRLSKKKKTNTLRFNINYFLFHIGNQVKQQKMLRLLPAWNLKNWKTKSFFCYCWILFLYIFHHSFESLKLVGKSIEVQKYTNLSIDEKFIVLPLYIHYFHVPVLHILLTEKKDRFYSTATQREHLCIDIFSELQWYPLISLRFVSSHRMNKNTKIPNGMTVKTVNKTKSKYRHDTVCTATNTECRLSLFIS